MKLTDLKAAAPVMMSFKKPFARLNPSMTALRGRNRFEVTAGSSTLGCVLLLEVESGTSGEKRDQIAWALVLSLVIDGTRPTSPETAMSPSLPQESLDLVIDCLRDDPIALKTCCVVSKPWASRARWHLFADVEFHPVKSPIESWMKAFPDPSNSPARYTRSLSIGVPSLLTSTNTDAHAWLRSFCRVVRLLVFKAVWTDDRPVSLTQLHGFSPILESLSLQYPSASPSGFLNLAVSFLSLKDLFLVSLAEGDADDGWSIPSTSPKFTGALVLITRDWIHPYARRLLDLPGGLHFSSVSILCSDRDAESTARLVSRCSDTIESLFIYYDFSGVFSFASVVGR